MVFQCRSMLTFLYTVFGKQKQKLLRIIKDETDGRQLIKDVASLCFFFFSCLRVRQHLLLPYFIHKSSIAGRYRYCMSLPQIQVLRRMFWYRKKLVNQ